MYKAQNIDRTALLSVGWEMLNNLIDHNAGLEISTDPVTASE